MAIILEEYRTDARCVFASCEHAPATKRYIHEFANYPEKPMCELHTKLVSKYGMVKR